MSVESEDAVGRIVEVVDLVADAEDVDQDDLLKSALGKVRKRGGN